MMGRIRRGTSSCRRLSFTTQHVQRSRCSRPSAWRSRPVKQWHWWAPVAVASPLSSPCCSATMTPHRESWSVLTALSVIINALVPALLAQCLLHMSDLSLNNAASVLDPQTSQNIKTSEAIRRSAKWFLEGYKQFSSVNVVTSSLN